MSTSSIPNPKLYEVVRVTADWFFNTCYDYTQSGLENVPQEGAVIFAANHVSFYDPPAIGACHHRAINYFARDTLFKGLFGKALVEIGTIPVARENAEIKSLKAIFKSLKAQGAVAIYPEGTRSADGQLAEPKPGAGMIACKSKATVIPTRLFGTYEAYGRNAKAPKLGGHIHIAYGTPMTTTEIDPGKAHPERYLEASRRIMQRIAALKPPITPIV
ncbi:lysophospholipid acyltransferase family protein [Coraliomargarita algicola]|uniref:Lysophospholipid acyltransferase family protein n=1 Tax=Coraliomargarita algicola TaxID=3092156 RepID=A0ABZ0RDU9_9BACT|nr:lysophospholipid acyltransferase family protein [Coraliomargarita sp. J2-16]WPJ94142.1 lysophospholipid acyltransferase family protein [Coraliomargarita sp. J2-16]